jgi:hypothetical protein
MAALLGDGAYLQAEILAHFNDKQESFLPENEVLQILNEVHRLIAQKGVFRKNDDLAAVADTSSYDLPTAFSDYIKVLNLTWNGDSDGLSKEMFPVTYDEYLKRKIRYPSLDIRPTWWAVDGLNLLVWPAPTANDDDAFDVRYAYMPDDIEDDAEYTLPIPKAWRHVYVYGALWIAYDKSIPSKKSQLLSDKYRGLFNEQLAYLLRSTYNGSTRLRSYR